MVIPAESFDPLAVMRTVQAERCTALYGVPTMFIAELDHPEFKSFDFSSLRTGIMAGSPCPVEVMKKVQKDMHMPEVTICYGMTETSPVSTQSRVDDPIEKRVSTVGQVHPHVEVKVIDPDHRPDRAPRDARRALHARLLGDARVLGRSARHPRGHRRRPVDAHRRPRHPRRRRLREDRRPHQGHGAARRREHLPARGGGVPLHHPRRLGRPGGRGAGREVRRGADGVGEAPPRRPPHRRGDPRLLQGQDRDLQDPPLLQVRGRASR